MLPDTTVLDEGSFRLIDLRSLAIEGSMTAADLGAMAQARSLCNWHLRHGHLQRLRRADA